MWALLAEHLAASWVQSGRRFPSLSPASLHSFGSSASDWWGLGIFTLAVTLPHLWKVGLFVTPKLTRMQTTEGWATLQAMQGQQSKQRQPLCPWNCGHLEKTTLKWKQPLCLFFLLKSFILWEHMKNKETEISWISSHRKSKQLGKLFLHLYLFFSLCLSGGLKPLWITVTGKACQALFLNSPKMPLESVLC